MAVNETDAEDESQDEGQDYDAREEHVARGHRPEDVGGTEETVPHPDREHPGDTPGGA
jgi:hypothetical protein